MKILFIRHAESLNNLIEGIPNMTDENYEKLRNPDPHISELGLKQVKLLIIVSN